MNTLRELWRRFAASKKYREHFVEAQVKQTIPFQIRALVKAKGLTQQELASRSGLTQGVISRAANPKYGNLSLNTLIRIAAGFDVAFIGRFVPFSELCRWMDHLHREAVAVSSFDEEYKRLVVEGTIPVLDTAHSAEHVERLVSVPVEPAGVTLRDSRTDGYIEHEDTAQAAAYAAG